MLLSLKRTHSPTGRSAGKAALVSDARKNDHECEQRPTPRKQPKTGSTVPRPAEAQTGQQHGAHLRASCLG
eukprot:7965492-Pyramimonas_sp.AAC.1